MKTKWLLFIALATVANAATLIVINGDDEPRFIAWDSSVAGDGSGNPSGYIPPGVTWTIPLHRANIYTTSWHYSAYDAGEPHVRVLMFEPGGTGWQSYYGPVETTSGGGGIGDADAEATTAAFWFVLTLGLGALIMFVIRKMTAYNHNQP